MAEKEQVRDFSMMFSLPLFSNLVDRRLQGAESLCPEHNISMLNTALGQAWDKKLTGDSQWKALLALSTAEQVERESWSWPSHLGPILGFKLHHILSGGGTLPGTIPRKPMSEHLSSRLRRVAKQLTQIPGWPTVIEEALFARWSHRGPNSTVPSIPSSALPSCDSGDPAHSLARSVLLNLTGIHQNAKSKQYANIVTNIELAAAYLGVMTLGVVDGDTDSEIADLLTQKLKSANAPLGASEVSDILHEANLPLVEFQAPLFSALAVSPLLLFRTCLLHSSRFGRSHYVSFLLTLGDMKPEALRSIETYIWRNLSLVSRRQLTAEAMIDLVLDSVVSPDITVAFSGEDARFKKELRKHFASLFEEERDDTSFFFPNVTTILKTDIPSGHLEDISYVPNSSPRRSITFDSDQKSASVEVLAGSSIPIFPHSLPSPAPTPSRAPGLTSVPHREQDHDPDWAMISRVTSLQTHGPSVVPPATPSSDRNQGSMRTIHPPVPHTIDSDSIDTPPPAPTPAPIPRLDSEHRSSDSLAPSDLSTHQGKTHVEAPVVLDAPPTGHDEDHRSTNIDISAFDGNPVEDSQSSENGAGLSNSGSNAPSDISSEAPAIPPPDETNVEPSRTQEESFFREQSPPLDNASPIVERNQETSAQVNGMDVDFESNPASTSISQDIAPVDSIANSVPLDSEAIFTDHDKAMDVDSEMSPDKEEHSREFPAPKSPSTSSDIEPSSKSHIGQSTAAADYLATLLAARPIPRTRSESPSPLHTILQSSSSDVRLSPEQSSFFSDTPFSLQNQPSTSIDVNPSVDSDSITSTLPQLHSGAKGDDMDTDLATAMGPLTGAFSPEDISSVDPSLLGSPGPPDNPQDVRRGDDNDDGRNSDDEEDVNGDNNGENMVNDTNGSEEDDKELAGDSDDDRQSHDGDQSIALRKSDRLAKRKLLEYESDGGGDLKRIKLDSPVRKRKPKGQPARYSARDSSPSNDNNDASSDIGSETADVPTPNIPVDNEDIDSLVPSLILEEKLARQQWRLPIDVYSADGRKYYRYYGAHYFPNFETDQLELAAHVEQWRSSLNLPIGSSTQISSNRSQWSSNALDLRPGWTGGVRGPVQNPNHARQAFYLLCWLTYSNRLFTLDASKFNEDDTDAVFSRATYEDFLSTNKIINSLHNPMGGDVPALPQLATDLRAASMIFPGFLTDSYVHLMTWGLLAKANAIHDPHVDRTGMCSWIAIEDGMKKWDFAFAPDPAKAAATESFGYDVTLKRNFERGWRWFSVLLSPGSMIIMRPGVVHSVTTLQDCIAVGGHFYAAATMTLTVYSIYHTFVNSSTITNGAVDNEQLNLLRILLYWFRIMCGDGGFYLDAIHTDVSKISGHVPNVLDTHGLENVLALMVFTELVGVLSPASYSQPRPVDFDDRHFQLPCFRAREIRLWLDQHFVVTTEGEGSVQDQTIADLFLKVLLQHSHKLWHDVKERSKRGSMGATCTRNNVICDIDAQDVYRAVSEIKVVPGFSKLWAAEIQKPTPESYEFLSSTTGNRYVLQRRD
ncbi:hypothetical protein D9757_015377 [Collybiopsis confluens]|uniref:JmjC domain-containing protein n=1 Tax=Collybiopsis confluens TaxID=2823264 RepID=A0A8H5CM64_9AGAR|nr:hypothetical protein D9757_015377 [Collybiopsis confluens]